MKTEAESDKVVVVVAVVAAAVTTRCSEKEWRKREVGMFPVKSRSEVK